ncbi:MAG: DMT family transporter [Cyclobacteriaceae bacterium]
MDSSLPNKNLTKGILYASGTALLWGFLAIFLKYALKFVDPVTLSWFRFSIAFLILTFVLYFRDKTKLNLLKKPPPIAILAGTLLAINYVAFITGIEKTTASNGQVFIQIGPLLLAAAGVFVFKEKLSPLQIMGFILATCGFVFFFNEQLSNVISFEQGNYKFGSFLVIGSAVCWSLYAIIQKTLVRIHNPQSLNLIIFGMPLILLLPFIDYSVFYALSFNQWLIIAFLGLNTVLAYGGIAEAFRYMEANKVAIIITVNPIITIITMSILAFMEVTFIKPDIITPYGAAGAFLVILGAIFAVGKKSKKSK